LRPLHVVTAQRAQIGNKGRGLLGVGGDVAGGKQPVELLLVERAVEPAQQKQRRPRQCNLTERDAQRKLEGRAGVLQKSAFDFSAARAGGLCDDQQMHAGVGRKLAAAPECASREFCLRVEGGVEMDFGGGFISGCLAPLAPGVEELALHG
jgi:hypothetical protein